MELTKNYYTAADLLRAILNDEYLEGLESNLRIIYALGIPVSLLDEHGKIIQAHVENLNDTLVRKIAYQIAERKIEIAEQFKNNMSAQAWISVANDFENWHIQKIKNSF